MSTFAGNSSSGYVNGIGTNAVLFEPMSVVLDASANLYVAEHSGNRIRKINVASASVTLLAGIGAYTYAEGLGTVAGFKNPCDIAVDKNGVLYVADRYNIRVRKVTPAGLVTTLAGGSVQGYLDGVGTNVRFNLPTGLAVDANGGNVYVSDWGNHRIRKITIATSTCVYGCVGVCVGVCFSHKCRRTCDFFVTVSVCAANTYGALGSTSCFGCPPGFFCPAGATCLTLFLMLVIRQSAHLCMH